MRGKRIFDFVKKLGSATERSCGEIETRDKKPHIPQLWGRDKFVDKMPLRRFRLIHFRARSRMPLPACAPGPPGPSAGAGASCQAGNGEKTFQSELTENENKYMGEKKHRNCDLFFVGVPGGCLAGSSCTRPGSPGRRTARAEGRRGRSETWCSRGWERNEKVCQVQPNRSESWLTISKGKTRRALPGTVVGCPGFRAARSTCAHAACL